MHRTTFPSTRKSLPTTGLGRMAASSNLSHKPTASSIQRRLAHIPTLHPFFTAHLTIIEVPAKRLVARMAILKQVTSLTSMIHQQLQPSQHNTDPDASYPDGVRGDHHVSGQSKSSKRKTQQSDGRAHKRLQVPSMLPPREDSFTLCSHFMSAPLDDRLQFLSWLFAGALPHCMSNSSPTACEERYGLATSCSSTSHEIEQNRGDRRKARGGSRKNMPWSMEEASLLLKLRKEESRSWSEVARLFSERYPGRTLGAIQVHWSTTLNKKAD